MTAHVAPARPKPVPNDWDRRGLPAWTYHSEALFQLERNRLFLTHWQLAGHVSDAAAPGDWFAFDLLGERALVVRGQDGTLRAFHNLCRHRGARVVAGDQGTCRGALVCPFHGWVYNTDGTLRGPSRPDSFGAFDRSRFGLRPIEMEVWQGFVFLRFRPGPQPPVATLLAPFAPDFEAYRAADLLPGGAGPQTQVLDINWKSARDVDNEGYHVAMAHPALQDLYGATYRDEAWTGGVSFSVGHFGGRPGRLWSVRHYLRIAAPNDRLPDRLRRAWTYYGLFPSTVIAFTPESAQFYGEVPLSPRRTELRGRLYRHPHESRAQRVTRYLATRIDRETSVEDRQLSVWSDESMLSSAFEGFHLSDLEWGLRSHHDRLREVLPVTRLAEPPPESEVERINEEMTLNATNSA